MNENAKTLIFVALAAAVVTVAVVTRPSSQISGPDDVRNQPLCAPFDPLKVTSLEIVDFDEQRGEVIPFQVAQVDVKGKARWAIPSHEDYPADAKDQVASAGASMTGLKILGMVSDNQGDQRVYGVVDPDPKRLRVGDTGVGERIVMKNKDGKTLLAMVVGKEVPSRPGLRYVRKVNESPIYIVEVKTEKLSTKFENWIERNLLQISSLDIKRVWIRDHSVDEMNSALLQRGETTIDYNDAGDPKWTLVGDRKFKINKDKPGEGQWIPLKMADDRELNAPKLDELKTALDDLKIVDVSRKPAGLSADLKAVADFTGNREAVESLARKGFFVAELQPDRVELFSNEGEIHIVMKDGVEYLLRFGGIAGSGESPKKGDKKKGTEKEAEADKDAKGSGLNRYLFVMAAFNSDAIPKPQLDPLPEAKKDAPKPGETKPGDKKPGEEKKPDEKKPEAAKAAPADRASVEKENKRKQEEYDRKIADGKKRAAVLNARFAEWYYVISDEVYRKIHLGHDEIFRKKEKSKDQGAEKKAEQPGASQDKPKTEAAPPASIEKMKEEGPAAKK